MKRVSMKQTQLNVLVHPQPFDAHRISYGGTSYGPDFEQNHPSHNFSQILATTEIVKQFIDTWILSSENATTVKSKYTKPYIQILGHFMESRKSVKGRCGHFEKSGMPTWALHIEILLVDPSTGTSSQSHVSGRED